MKSNSLLFPPQIRRHVVNIPVRFYYNTLFTLSYICRGQEGPGGHDRSRPGRGHLVRVAVDAGRLAEPRPPQDPLKTAGPLKELR